MEEESKHPPRKVLMKYVSKGSVIGARVKNIFTFATLKDLAQHISKTVKKLTGRAEPVAACYKTLRGMECKYRLLSHPWEFFRLNVTEIIIYCDDSTDLNKDDSSQRCLRSHRRTVNVIHFSSRPAITSRINLNQAHTYQTLRDNLSENAWQSGIDEKYVDAIYYYDAEENEHQFGTTPYQDFQQNVILLSLFWRIPEGLNSKIMEIVHISSSLPVITRMEMRSYHNYNSVISYLLEDAWRVCINVKGNRLMEVYYIDRNYDFHQFETETFEDFRNQAECLLVIHAV